MERFEGFEAVARQIALFSDRPETTASVTPHPFDLRGVHPALPAVVRELFDDGHYAQATFEALKFIDGEVQRHAGSNESGTKLMMQVFGGDSPNIKLSALANTSDKDEQEGFKFLFAGAMLAIRNPRGHKYAVRDSPDDCLDHLSMASMLLRRLADAGYVPTG